MFAATLFTAMLAMAETPSDVNNKAVGLYREGRYTEAEQTYRSALDAWKRTHGSARDQAVTLNNLAVLYRATARYEDALEAQQEAVRELRAIEGDRGPAVAMALANQADLLRLTGNTEQASATARESLEIYRSRYPDNPGMATALQVLASAEIDRKAYLPAREMLSEALRIRERAFGPQAELTGSVWSSLATLELQTGNYRFAESAARKALAITRESRSEKHPATAACLNNLAQALRLQGQYADAEPLYRQAIAVWETALGREHPDTAKGIMNLAAFYHDRGRERGAEQLYREARDILARTLGPQHPTTLTAAAGLADVNRAQGRTGVMTVGDAGN
jgi:tetratricopeptide (TPR) repeat protein